MGVGKHLKIPGWTTALNLLLFIRINPASSTKMHSWALSKESNLKRSLYKNSYRKTDFCCGVDASLHALQVRSVVFHYKQSALNVSKRMSTYILKSVIGPFWIALTRYSVYLLHAHPVMLEDTVNGRKAQPVHSFKMEIDFNNCLLYFHAV